MANTTTNVKTKKLVDVNDADDVDDEIFYYIGVRASPFATDCSVFGLSSDEQTALRSRFPKTPDNTDIINGIMIKG